MPISTLFDQIGAGAKSLFSGEVGSSAYDQGGNTPAKSLVTPKIVKPQSRQLGNAIPAQTGSLMGLIKPKNSPQQLATKLPSTPSPSNNYNQPFQKPVAEVQKPNNNQQSNNQGSYSPQYSGLMSQGSDYSESSTPQNQTNQNNSTGANASLVASSPGLFNQNVQNLTNYGAGQESPQLTKARQDLVDFQKEKANQTREINTGGTWTSRATGQQHQADIQNAATEAALQTAVNTAQASQGQQIGAAQQGASISGQQISPGTSFVDVGSGGKEIYSGLGGLTGLGIANQNIKQGQQYQQQSADLGVALNGLKSVSSFADNFIQRSGLNQSSSPFFNQQQNTTLGQLKASDIGTYNELVNQVQTYANQIFASTGMTPTEAGVLAKNINIDGMTAPDLKTFLGNLDTLGQARKSILDIATKNSYGANNGNAGIYTGNTSSGESLQTNPGNGTIFPNTNASLQAIAGGTANFGGDALAMGAAIKSFLHL